MLTGIINIFVNCMQWMHTIFINYSLINYINTFVFMFAFYGKFNMFIVSIIIINKKVKLIYIYFLYIFK